MIATVYSKDKSFEWIDVVQPTADELKGLAAQYGLHATSVEDCLDPEHLPKYERIGDTSFVILRGYDEASVLEADTIQELTRKTAIFFNSRFVITVHRKDQPHMEGLRDRWKSRELGPGVDPASQIVFELIESIVATFEAPIEKALYDLEQVEMGVFGELGAKPFRMRQGYFLRRKAFVFKRMLRIMLELLPRIPTGLSIAAQDLQNIKEHIDALYLGSDDVMESINSLLNLHISLSTQKTNEASHRTGEVVRVLTILSMFLLPLNVITGIYGMNFEHMPELKSHYGYPLALLAMLSVSVVSYLWFKRRGWLK